MAINDRTRKLLWGGSAFRCAICRTELVVDATPSDSDNESIVGDECHIISGQANGPRYDPSFPQAKIDSYSNVIILCKVCHKMVDDQPETYTRDYLLQIKKDHEQWVRDTLSSTAVPEFISQPNGSNDQYSEFCMYEGETRRQIISRGCWDVIIRPTDFVRDRLGIQELFPLLQKLAVKRAGFEFPIVRSDTQERIYLEHIGQDVEFQNFLGSWQFFQSGFFADRSGMWWDWRDRAGYGVPDGWRPCEVIGIPEVILRFTAAFEFASLLADSKAGEEWMYVHVRVAGLGGRRLYLDYPVPELALGPLCRTSLREFPYQNQFLRSDLRRSSRQLALESSRELLRRFVWDPTLEILGGIQSALWH
jgi:hypothetical protein